MKVSFVGQGFENSDNPIGVLLNESFADESYTKFLSLVAFARSSGIRNLSGVIQQSKENIDEFQVIVGIDQKGTTKEALEDLLELDIGASVFYTRSPSTFHPKIYVFEGPDNGRVIVGSSNLTNSGLFRNVESSILVDFEKPDEDGEAVITDIREYYQPLISGTSPNVHKLSTDLINMLYESNLVDSEVDTRGNSESSASGQSDTSDEVRDLFPPIDVARPPAEHSGPGLSDSEVRQVEEMDTGRGPLLWEKPDLPRSDAQDPRASHVTGQLRFSQAGWEVSGDVIDQTTYFRYDVFSDFDWEEIETNPIVESAQVIFHVNLDDEYEGYHQLELIHKPVWEAEQRNVTTMLRWGELNQKVSELDLTGKTFYLYRPENGSEPYYIVIR
ncbi:phospholipase D-like domain-containing protein [Halobellus captivus]|uniref:phospholipase D-like domain-containing protein n=1 Tax=Halobellus captivus TaxID=2592614 RepID=UPI0011A97605|nr:phospholipase D family protein [Halobellus captivus]